MLRTGFLNERRSYMTTLRARWEKPDYTGVIAEVPLGHVPHSKISQTGCAAGLILIFLLVSGPQAPFFLGKAAPPSVLQLLPSLIFDSCECDGFEMCFPPAHILGGLLPGIWNVPDWETCIFFWLKLCRERTGSPDPEQRLTFN